MSNSDTMTEQQKREEKVKVMDSMCVMAKGKQTYLGLTRRQWTDRVLEVGASISTEELAEDDFHIVEFGQVCEPGSDSDDLESIDSEDEENVDSRDVGTCLCTRRVGAR
eukprot:1194134-Prymnesium_polylepis.1